MAADMNQCHCAPAPSALPETNSNLAKLVPFGIGALVVVGVVMLFVLHVLGCLRRRSSNKALHGVVVGAYSLSYALVSYTLGLMQSSTYYVYEFSIWAVCLLLLVGSADCLTASSLNDIESWKSHIVKHLIHGMWGVWIVLYVGLLPGTSDFPVTMKVALWFMLFIILLKSYMLMPTSQNRRLLCILMNPRNNLIPADDMIHTGLRINWASLDRSPMTEMRINTRPSMKTTASALQ